MPPPFRGGTLSDDERLISVCLSDTYIEPKLRTERPRKNIIGTELTHNNTWFRHHVQSQQVTCQPGADPELVCRGGVHVERLSSPLPSAPHSSLPHSLPCPLPSLPSLPYPSPPPSLLFPLPLLPPLLVYEMTYTVSSGTLNSSIPYLPPFPFPALSLKRGVLGVLPGKLWNSRLL